MAISILPLPQPGCRLERGQSWILRSEPTCIIITSWKNISFQVHFINL
jgi:hypothetical protein